MRETTKEDGGPAVARCRGDLKRSKVVEGPVGRMRPKKRDPSETWFGWARLGRHRPKCQGEAADGGFSWARLLGRPALEGPREEADT